MEEVIELCPNCMKENDFLWDLKKDGYKAHCLHCGEIIKLCSECELNKSGKCDWNAETGNCSKVTEHGSTKGLIL